MLKAYLSTHFLSAFMINKTHGVAQNPRRKQLIIVQGNQRDSCPDHLTTLILHADSDH